MTPITAAACLAVGRVAVVTGANKGIGYFIALQLGMSGLFSNVILGCRDATRGQSAIERLQASTTSESSSKFSCLPLEVGNPASHEAFRNAIDQQFGKVDVLVNNAAMAFKGADPTPFEKQCKPTLDVNFRGTVDFTETMLPLVKRGQDARIVNVASMAGALRQLRSTQLQQAFTSPTLTIPELRTLVDEFESGVIDGTYADKGWGSSNYGLSKLAVIAATRIWARENPDIAVNSCCPGYCKTDMSSQKGTRDPNDGAKNAVMPATMKDPPTGEFFQNYEIGTW